MEDIQDHFSSLINNTTINDATEEFELECRLGYASDNRFDTNVGPHFFELLINTLEDNEWDSKKRIHSVQYTDKHGYKLRIPEKGQERVIKKNRIGLQDYIFCGAPVDFRFCLSKEIHCLRQHFSDQTKYENIRMTDRIRYTKFPWNYDLSIVYGYGDIVKNYEHPILHQTRYEIEIELDATEAKKNPDLISMLVENAMELSESIEENTSQDLELEQVRTFP